MTTPLETAPGVRPRRLWSVRPRSDRESGDAVASNFALHWFPARSFRRSLDWNYSFWLGTISAALFLLLILSGIPLMFLHIPSVERAYLSVKDIEYVVTFGSWIRAVHRLSAHLMVAVVFLHLVRVFLTGAYKNGHGRAQHREWNWVIGVAMLVSTLFLSFTGYLLPWDQLAFWAVTVGTNIAAAIPVIGPSVRELLIGGRNIDQPTLLRFYVLHIVFLPGLLGVLFAYHMWRVRKDGGLARADQVGLAAKRVEQPPSPNKTYSLLGIARGTGPTVRATTLQAPDELVNSVPDLVRRIAIVVLGTIASLSVLAVFVRSPLEEPANPLVTPNPAKAPWYFLWLQELVASTTVRVGSFAVSGGFVGGILVPGVLLLLAAAWPFLDRTPVSAEGRWFARPRRRQNLVFSLVALGIVALILLSMYCRGPSWGFYWPWQPWPQPPTSL